MQEWWFAKACKVCKKALINRQRLYCSKHCKNKFFNDQKPRLTNKSYLLARENYLKELDYITKQVIYGSLLGDGCLIKSTKGYRFSIGSSQQEYLEWKKSLTNHIFQQNKPSQYQYVNLHYFYHSISHPFFINLYKIFYTSGKKTITRNILDKVDNLALAIWYQDDGSFNHNPNSRQITLCTDSFDFEQHKVIQKWFIDKWKIEVKIQLWKAETLGGNKIRYRIRINKLQVPDFISLIKFYIQPCMSHKLPK